MWVKCFASIFFIFIFVGLPDTSDTALAQETSESPEAAKERIAAERFLQVLVRRPRPGTALDRVYGYHIQAGSLDALEAELKADGQSPAERGANLMLCGLLQLQRGNDAAAAESLAQAETLRSDDAMASFYLGKALLLIGKSDEAAEALQRAIDRKPEKSEALPVFTTLGRLYSRNQQTEKALAVWKQLEATFPGDVRVGEQIARTLAEEDQNEAALERYVALAKKAANSDETRAVGYTIEAAEIKRRLGRHDEALKDFESLLSKLRPSSWLYNDVRHRIENGFLRTGDYAALADYYAKQVEQTPDNLELRLRLGHSLTKAGRLNEAEAALEEATERAPESSDARLALIEIYRTAGKAAKVAEQLEILIKQEPNNPDFYVRLGNVWLDDRTSDKAIRYRNAEAAWQRLADLRKDDAVVLSQVADLMRRIEQSEKAIALYRRAVELAPEQPQYREYLGEFLHRLDRKEEALEVWSSIAAESRANRENFVRLGEVLLTFEYQDKSLEAFAEAAKLDLTFAQRLRYAELLSRAEKHDEALAQLDQAEKIAESFDEQEQLLASRIQAYGNSGTLDKKINETAKRCETSKDAQDFRRLAMMYDAAARTLDATRAIQAAAELDPKDVAVLTFAADLYRKSSRYTDAIEAYRSLVKLDARFTSNYLKQIASLQMQLGQVDEAMATANELIAAQPGNPESYRVYAQQCFTLGRDDEGIEKLRRALQAAPRDIEAKRALATALADHFRTDEAIELNWQLLGETEEQSTKESIAATLATLYERKGDFERLVERFELRGRESSNMREAVLLTSAAYRATNDFGGARAALEPLLVDNPRDAELLGQFVTLSEAAGEPEIALEYQRQVVSLADTPEQRSRLVNLLIASGQLDAVEAAVQYLKTMDDPALALKMIDRALGQNDAELATTLSRQAIEHQKDFWEARLRLVTGLLLESKFNDALSEADQIDELQLDDNTLSLAAKERAKRAGKTNQGTTYSRNASFGYSQSDYELAAIFHLGNYANSRSSMRLSVFNLNDFSEGKALLTGLRFIANIKLDKADEFLKRFPSLQDLDKVDDLQTLRAALQVSRQKSIFLGQPNEEQGDLTQTKKLLWQIAKLDEKARKEVLEQLLMMQIQSRFPEGLDGKESKEVVPLSSEQLDLMRETFVSEIANASMNAPSYQSMIVSVALQKEFEAAGRVDDANKFATTAIAEPKTLAQFMHLLMRQYVLKGQDSLSTTIDQVSSHLPNMLVASTASERSEVMQQLLGLCSAQSIPVDTKFKVIDLVIALNIEQKPRIGQAIARSRTGTLNTYHRGSNGNYSSKVVPVPFSSQLLNDSFVQQLHQTLALNAESNERSAWLKHLQQDQTLYPPDSAQAKLELKSRRVLFAFSKWWADDLEGASQEISDLVKQWPEDGELAIEKARIAAERELPDEALAALDQIHAVDQSTLQIRELAALNLSASLGNMERGKLAAQRLFGMRLDTSTEMTLADQMLRLGLNDLAKAVLQRSQRRGGQQVQDLLQIANRYLSAKESELAAEVAYKALRQLGTNPNDNDSYYRQQIVQVLTQAGKLDPLLKQAEQRVASAPKSVPLKMQLAELYTAAGRSEDADKLFEEVAAQKPNDPRTMWQTAVRMSASGKNDEAMTLFLNAIEKDPAVMQQDSYRFINAMRQVKSTEPVYERLAGMQLPKFEPYILQELIQIANRGGTNSPNEQFLKFVDKVLSNSTPETLANILQAVTRHSDIQKRPSLRDAVSKCVSSDLFFKSNNSLWVPNSYSSGGRIYGALDPFMDLLKVNSDLKELLREQATKRLEQKDLASVAKLLLIMIEVDERVDRSDPIKHLQQMLDTDKAKKDDAFGDYEGVPGQMWWQVAQRLEATSGYEDMAVTILEKLQTRDDLNAMNGPEYTISAKLADAYVTAKQPEKARVLLLRNFRSPGDERMYASNPGYAEYRKINAVQTLAGKLTRIEAKSDAIAVYAEILSQPEIFAAAKTWGGGNQEAQFEKGQQELIERLSEEDCLIYLAKRLEVIPAESSAGKTETIPALKLIPLQPSAVTRFGAGSFAMLAVTKLAETESGKQALADLSGQLEKRKVESPDDWSIASLHLMLGIGLKHSELQAQVADFKERLSKLDINAEKKDKRSERLLTYLQPATMLLAADDQELRNLGTEMVGLIRGQAELAKLPTVIQATATVTLKWVSSGSDPSAVRGTLIAMLDAAAPAPAANANPSVVSSASANECLRVAEVAAASQQWPIMFEAIKRGLGGGAPLLTQQSGSRSTRGAFIAQSTRTIGRSNSDELEDLTQYSNRLIKLFKQLDTVLAKQADAELSRAAYQSLQQVIMPDGRPKELFPYLSSFGSSATPSDTLTSLLAEYAIAAEQTDVLRKQLDDRAVSCESPEIIDLIHIQLATTEKNWPLVEEKLKQLVARTDLPSIPALSGDAPQNLLLKNKLYPVWTALAPLLDVDEVEPIATSTLCGLLEVAARNTTVWHSFNWQTLAHKAPERKSLADEQLMKVVSDYLDGVRLTYASSPDYVKQMVARESRRFVNAAILSRKLKSAAFSLQSYVESAPPFNETAGGFSQMALRLMQLEDQPRYELLWQSVFGNADANVCTPVGDLVMYAEPPAVLKSETQFEQASRLPLPSSDFPIITNIWLLADAAAKLQKSDDVIKQLEKFSKASGDEYQAMIGTVLLAAGRNEEALPIMQSVATVLTATKPKTGEKSPMPIHSAVFAAQAMEASSTTPSLTKPTQEAWSALLTHSRERHIGIAGSYINRMVARAGVDKAVGAKAGSPLKHFISYEIPYRSKPHMALESTYVLKGNQICYSSGNDQSLLLFKYPLAGDFSFQFVNERHGWGESSAFYGGVIYKSKEYNKTLYLEGLMARGELEWPNPTFENNKNGNVSTLTMEGDVVAVSSNGKELLRDHRRRTMPFVGVHHMSHVIAVSRDYQISGNPTIPREVSLLDPELRGWGTSIIAESMPTIDLPKPPGSTDNSESEDRQTSDMTWSYRDGALQSASREFLENRGDMHHVQYMRPLLEGESIEYEFDFEAGKQEVHPTLGRVVILLRDNGVKLRWLSLSHSLETMDLKPNHEVAIDEMLGDGKPDLKAGKNKVTLTAEGDRCVLSVNDKAIGRIPMALDRRFGITIEKNREARVTSAKLSGPWPTEVPQEIMEPANSAAQ